MMPDKLLQSLERNQTLTIRYSAVHYTSHNCNYMLFVEISMSVLPTFSAATSMRCAAVLWGRTHAPVRQDI